MYELRRTGRAIPFTKVVTGCPFFAHGRMWIKVSQTVGAKLSPSDYHDSWCDFVSDPEDEIVEYVNFIVDGKPMVPPENVEKMLKPIKPTPPPPQLVVKGVHIPGVKPLV